jgi:SAM-dependent methyltransferase
MIGLSDLTDYYNTRSGWGKPPDDANLQRIHGTLALVPTDVRTVLDAGCGDGKVSNQLVVKGRRVVGVDISEVALRGFRGSRVRGSIDHLPFASHSYDLVLCAETLEHLPVGMFESSLDEIERVAGRYVIITTPNEEYLPAGFAKCENCGYAYHMNLHFRAFDQESHSALFEQFKVVRTEGILSWKHSRLLVFLRQKLFGFYRFKRRLICPRCGHRGVREPGQGLIWRILLKVVGKLEHKLPARSKARWIASLYQRA